MHPWPGGPRRFLSPASHRSGLARLTHPARQEWNSLRYARNHPLIATCAPEGERMRRLGSCGRVPVHRFHSRLSLPSAGSSGSLSLLRRYYEELRLLAVRRAAFVVLSQRYRAAFVPFARGRLERSFARAWRHSVPALRRTGSLHRRRRGLPSSCKTPVRARPALRPRWDSRVRPLRHARIASLP